MKLTRLYLPENLDVESIQTFCKQRGHNKNYFHKLLFVISTIYLQRVKNRALEKDDFVPLSKVLLARSIGSNFVKPVREYLVQLGIIELDETDKRGTKGNGCIGYRLCHIYRQEKVRDFYATFFPAPRLPSAESNVKNHSYILGHLQKVTICAKEAKAAAEALVSKSIESYNCGIISIDMIDDRNWFFSTDIKTGRVFHNVSNINRELRPFLRYSGKELAEVDISNCQPLLLYFLYENKDSDEARRYLELVETGKFYELLQLICSEPDRDRVKKQFLTFLFGKNHLELKAGEAFKGQFPELARILNRAKHREHNALALSLQKLEANLVINTVVPICAEKGIPIITIHDSILTTPEHIETVRLLLRTECKRLYGIIPNVKEKLPCTV